MFVHAPPFVRGRRQTAREKILFVRAQAGNVADFSQNSSDFFFHVSTLLEANFFVHLVFHEADEVIILTAAGQGGFGCGE